MIVSGPPSRRYVWEPITIVEQLERTVTACGANEAVVGPERRLTWNELRDEARSFAKALVAAGIERGDHIAVWLPNQIEWVVAWFGAAYAGAVVIPINTRYKTEEVRYILRQSDSKLLLMRSSFLVIDFRPMLESLLRPSNAAEALTELRTVVTLGEPAEDQVSLADFLAAIDSVDDAELERRAGQVGYEDPTIIVYTSGTTGHPKGAVHSHRILRNECSITEWMDIGPESRILGHMPFFHVAGAFSGILPALTGGGAIVLMDHWDTDEALRLIRDERVTILNGIPTHFIDLLKHPALDQYDTSSLRAGWIGGAANPPEVIDGAMQKLGVRRLLPVYGMTETTSVTTFPRPDDPREIILSGTGVPVSDFEVMIADADTGEELGPNVEGEICVRGHCVMQGYYKNPEATHEVLGDDGWFHTGDLGMLNEAGYLAVTGRKSDMFIVGGSNAYPAEIELVLCGHPAVAQAYVVGVPDPRLGEVGFAFVQTHRGAAVSEAEIVQFCKGRLADFKVPRHVRFVDDFPLTATGKIQRFRLVELAAAEPAVT